MSRIRVSTSRIVLALVVLLSWAVDTAAQPDVWARTWCHSEDRWPVEPVDIDAVLAGGPAVRRAASVARPDHILFRAIVNQPQEVTAYIDAARCMAFKNQQAQALRVLLRAREVMRETSATGAAGRTPEASGLWTEVTGASSMPALRAGSAPIPTPRGGRGIVFVDVRVDREGRVRSPRVVGSFRLP